MKKIVKIKQQLMKKPAGLRCRNSSDLSSACFKVLIPIKIFQFSDMHYENRCLDTFRGHNMRPEKMKKEKMMK